MYDQEVQAAPRVSKRNILLFGLAIVGLMLLVYGSILNAEFVRWDDDLLVFENPAVRTMTPWSIKQIFTTYDPELYIPLTLFSYQLNVLVGGLDPFVYHLTNLLLHAASALVLSGIVLLLTRKRLVAAVTGVLFAIHPLHTEAVAWVSARKDVLSMTFFLLSILCYLLYQDRDRRKWFHYSLAFFVCALLSKVIAITLPIVLILLDLQKKKTVKESLLRDKIPFFVLSVIFGIIAVFGKSGQASVTTPFETVVMASRSMVFYLGKIFAPFNLSVIYPESGSISLGNPTFLIAAILVIAITIAAFLLRNRFRILATSWLFFLVTLGPTFPLYRKGFEGGDVYFASDRYAYIPSIGIIVLLVVVLHHLLRRWRHGFLVASILLIASCSWLSYKQSRHWENSEALFTNALSLYPMAQAAHNNLGMVYYIKGDLTKAQEHFEEAITIRPLASTYANLGSLYRRKGDLSTALGAYQTAIKMSPSERDAYFGLGILFAQAGRISESELAYQKAIAIRPSDASTYLNLGGLYAQAGEWSAAIDQYLLALERNPYYANAYFNLGMAYKKLGRMEEAKEAFTKALQYDSSMEPARGQLIGL
ncbi:MAG: tetratricopeptide repeat protein [Candidatus Peribacteraceae bacterium]|jgi:tetratricopeptide (TPR) repeat protein|nr:tetratricopeptide repeat protein [Candidatus Peribacteraceae bacterium]|tara:strand:- start:15372 stop:17147 length:1776 start_codon:yes stop_codon:yes gene_type:complete